MPALAELSYFANPRAFAFFRTQQQAAFGEFPGDGLAVFEAHLGGGEFVSGPVFIAAFAIGLAGDAFIFPEFFEEGGAVAFAVKDEGEAREAGVGRELFRAGLIGDVFFKSGDDLAAQDFDHAGVDGLVDFKNGDAAALVDPVVGGGSKAESLAGDVVFGKLGLAAVVDAHVAVDEVEQAAGAVFETLGFHPVFGEFGRPVFYFVVAGGDELDFFSKGFHSGTTV